MSDGRFEGYESPLSRVRDSFAGGDPAWPVIAELAYDPLHRLVLDLARCCFESLETSDTQASKYAMSCAMQALGVDAGVVLFARVMAAAQSLEDERRTSFHHLTVDCARITPDEQAFMNIIALARIDRPTQALQATMLLTRTDACPATFATIEILGSECAKLEGAASLASARVTGEPYAIAH